MYAVEHAYSDGKSWSTPIPGSSLIALFSQYDKDGKSTVMTLEQLLPMSFGPEKLLTTEEMSNGVTQ